MSCPRFVRGEPMSSIQKRKGFFVLGFETEPKSDLKFSDKFVTFWSWLPHPSRIVVAGSAGQSLPDPLRAVVSRRGGIHPAEPSLMCVPKRDCAAGWHCSTERT
eukprot:233263-Amphidinium_carterae.2